MKTLVAAFVCANALDETSLMQNLVTRSSGKLDLSQMSTAERGDKNARLLETAVNMIKNGVTPDVVQFVDATLANIEDDVLPFITDAHTNQQNYLKQNCMEWHAVTIDFTTITNLNDQQEEASVAHQECRSDEAVLCARHRRCEEQLIEKWREVVTEERIIREIHWQIDDEWCVAPPDEAPLHAPWTNLLSHEFNWADISPYPDLNVHDIHGADIIHGWRATSVTRFSAYIEQKPIVERVWTYYNEKLLECYDFEVRLEADSGECDEKQDTLNAASCVASTTIVEARANFANEWETQKNEYYAAEEVARVEEVDRWREWETLKIVQCLLQHIHSTVETSINTGAPCPTIDSDPDGVTLAIQDCHIITTDCCAEEGTMSPPLFATVETQPGDTDCMTSHLCMEYCPPPPIPVLPPYVEPPCTPGYIAKEQGTFRATIQTAYTLILDTDEEYQENGQSTLIHHFTQLSEAGWAGCAAPKVCVDCAAFAPTPPNPDETSDARVCLLHEMDLSPGQIRAGSFRCREDGLHGSCVHASARCNGVANCDDGSDELLCHTSYGKPGYLSSPFVCPADLNTNWHFQCDNGACIEKAGLCNGINNCADGTDEVGCSLSDHTAPEAPRPAATYAGEECCDGSNCDQSVGVPGNVNFDFCRQSCADRSDCIGIEYGNIGVRCESEDSCKCYLITGTCTRRQGHSGYNVYLNHEAADMFTLGGSNSEYPGYGCLSGENDVTLTDHSLAQCQTACETRSTCKSFDFYVGRTGHTCSLSDSNFADVGTTTSTTDCRYYERSAPTSSLLQTHSSFNSHSGTTPVRTTVRIRTTVRVESTSGRTIRVETPTTAISPYQDREGYTFDSLGDFSQTTMIRYSNDDKSTDDEHVMTKIFTVEPTTVFIVKLQEDSLPWLFPDYTLVTDRTGVSYSGTQGSRHTAFSGVLTNSVFDANEVYSRTFEAGTISVPGNNGGNGGFLMFLEPA